MAVAAPSRAGRSIPTQACVAIDDSAQGNVFKGLALATDKNWIYATDFHNNRIEVYDALWADAPNAGFVNPKVAQGYAPFGIAYLDGHIFVTYAKQGAGAKDDVSGHGHGFVAEFDTDGNLLCQVAEHGELNSPWGLAMAPSDFGRFGGHLLVGNFGDGRINAFERGHDEHGQCHWRHRGALHGTKGKLEVDGLWSIGFGNDHASGSHNTLYFSAGPNGEANGLFGAINWTPK